MIIINLVWRDCSVCIHAHTGTPTHNYVGKGKHRRSILLGKKMSWGYIRGRRWKTHKNQQYWKPHNKGVFGGDDDSNFVVVDFFIIVSILVVMKLAFKIGNQYQKKNSIKAVGYAWYKRHSKQWCLFGWHCLQNTQFLSFSKFFASYFDQLSSCFFLLLFFCVSVLFVSVKIMHMVCVSHLLLVSCTFCYSFPQI